MRVQLGAEVQGYRDRVSAVSAVIGRVRLIDSQLGRLGRDQTSDVKTQAGLQERLRGIRSEQDRTQSNRVAAVTALQRAMALGLVRVADVNIDEPGEGREWTVTQGVQFARALDAALPEIDSSDERYNRLASQVFSEFTDLPRALGRHGHEAAYTPRDDGVRVVVTFRGREMLLVELAAQLGDQIDQHMRLLSAKERDIIQSHLITEVGVQLSELIGEADGQIVQLNNELRTRPTSTGMTLRVLGKPRFDGPAHLSDVRQILATTADVWNDEDRLLLGDFLQARIAQVRDADEAGNWSDHLGEAPDYRRCAWSACGVVVDELSSTVLAVGLPGGAGSPTAIAALHAVGQPAVLTYRQLAVDDGGTVPSQVFVCENPAVVAAAADRFGANVAPLVCVNGQPGAAIIRLLTRLADGGATLRSHGDFDAGGLSIARTLARTFPWIPWRFRARDYRIACESS